MAENPGHLVAIHFDDGGCHLNLIHVFVLLRNVRVML